jgi:putative oligomerization/nucleic acid binding protein
MQGLRAKVTERAGWTVFGVGAGGIWLAVMLVSIFVPVMVTGTPPMADVDSPRIRLRRHCRARRDWVSLQTVKVTFFETSEAQPPAETTATRNGPELTADDAPTKLRQLAQLRDSGLISEGEFQAKKDELLIRM